MAAEAHVQDAGAARKAKEAHVHDGTAVRAAKEIWVQDAVAARKVFQAGAIVNPLGTLTVSDTETSPTQALGRITFGTDGSISYVGNGAGGTANWFAPAQAGIGSGYWIRVTNSGGDLWGESYVSGSLNQLSAALQLTWSIVGGLKIVNATVQIYSDAGGTTLVSSGTLSGTVESSL